jgi:hypothetical protein
LHRATDRLVQDVFTNQQKFNVLTQSIAGLKDNDWYQKQPRDIICEKFDDLIEFVSKTSISD